MKGDIKDPTETQIDKDFREWMGEDMSNEPTEEDEENTSPSTMTVGELRKILGINRVKYPSGND